MDKKAKSIEAPRAIPSNQERADMERRAPEIFIVGTMKGGTTILYDYICTHPRVMAGKQKEIHYFSMYPQQDFNWYLANFPERPADSLSIDASPTYFDIAEMPTIPAYIKKAVPSARIIVIVRDPVARTISHFQHLRLVSHKDTFATIDVNEFLRRPLERCYAGQHPTDAKLTHVLGFSLYDAKFLNYQRVFGPDAVLVVTNEELTRDPVATMRKVFEHCRLEYVPSDLFGVRRYQSGSEALVVASDVTERLRGLLYPSYDRFRRLAGLPRPV